MLTHHCRSTMHLQARSSHLLNCVPKRLAAPWLPRRAGPLNLLGYLARPHREWCKAHVILIWRAVRTPEARVALTLRTREGVAICKRSHTPSRCTVGICRNHKGWHVGSGARRGAGGRQRLAGHAKRGHCCLQAQCHLLGKPLYQQVHTLVGQKSFLESKSFAQCESVSCHNTCAIQSAHQKVTRQATRSSQQVPKHSKR